MRELQNYAGFHRDIFVVSIVNPYFKFQIWIMCWATTLGRSAKALTLALAQAKGNSTDSLKRKVQRYCRSSNSVNSLRAKREACNPNLQVVITHASHVCSQHSFGLPLRMYGIYRTHFDHACFDICHVKLTRSTALEQMRFDQGG